MNPNGMLQGQIGVLRGEYAQPFGTGRIIKKGFFMVDQAQVDKCAGQVHRYQHINRLAAIPSYWLKIERLERIPPQLWFAASIDALGEQGVNRHVGLNLTDDKLSVEQLLDIVAC